MAIGDRKRREKPPLGFAEPDPSSAEPLIRSIPGPQPVLPVPVSTELPPRLNEWLNVWWVCDRYELLRSGFWLYRRNDITAEDQVQQAIVDLHDRWRSGEIPLPASPAELHAQISHRAQQVSDATRKREARNRKKLEEHLATLTLYQVIDQILKMEDKERKAFFAQLFDALKPRARSLLNLLLKDRTDYGKNQELADYFGTSVNEIVNLKRQIERRARPVAINFLLDIDSRRGPHENR